MIKMLSSRPPTHCRDACPAGGNYRFTAAGEDIIVEGSHQELRNPNRIKPAPVNVKITARHTPLPWGLLLMTAAMLALIFYSGLRFKSAAFTNEVAWIGGRAGLRFGNSGIAYGDAALTAAAGPASAPSPLSIEMAVKPGTTNDAHFRLVLLLHGGDDDTQLVIGQWKSWLIVMHGDDYDAKRRRARIAVNAFESGKERFIAITSGPTGTAVFLDGELARRSADLHLHMPQADGHMRIVLGNSIYGRHSWVGEIYGLAYFDRELADAAIENHFRRWDAQRTFAFDVKENAAGLYLFEEGRGAVVADHAAGGNDLQLPERMVILTKEFLAAPFAGKEYNLSLFQDMVINTIGFFPMGFLLSTLLWHFNWRDLRIRLALAMLACGAMSLVIEVAQAWIPTRSSQMLDLILNTLGAGIGVLLQDLYRRAFPRAGTTPQNP